MNSSNQTPLTSFFDWFSATPECLTKPWVILGKGPTFARRIEFDLSAYNLIGLNHVPREQKVLVVHVVDLDVIETHGSAIAENARILVMPWRPHVRYRPVPFSSRVRFTPTYKTLLDFCKEISVLEQLASERRLLWYNLGTTRNAPEPGSAIVPSGVFGAGTAVNLLAEAGVKQIFTLGVDGGEAYSGNFSDLEGKTRLLTGQSSYNDQFKAIAQTISKRRIFLAPLTDPRALPVWVEPGSHGTVVKRVTEFSILKCASRSVEFLKAPPTEKNALIYQAGVICRSDVRSAEKHAPIIFEDAVTLPWHTCFGWNARRWCALLLEAVHDGFISSDELREDIASGLVRPSLWEQVARGISDPLLLRKRGSGASATRNILWPLALLREWWAKNRIARMLQEVLTYRWYDPSETVDFFTRRCEFLQRRALRHLFDNTI